MTVNKELESTCCEALRAYFKIMSRRLAGGTEKTHKNPHSIQSVLRNVQWRSCIKKVVIMSLNYCLFMCLSVILLGKFCEQVKY